MATTESQKASEIEKAIVEGFKTGRAPAKLVTGTQETSGVNFDLKPGAIVAHAGANVVFVCG